MDFTLDNKACYACNDDLSDHFEPSSPLNPKPTAVAKRSRLPSNAAVLASVNAADGAGKKATEE